MECALSIVNEMSQIIKYQLVVPGPMKNKPRIGRIGNLSGTLLQDAGIQSRLG